MIMIMHLTYNHRNVACKTIEAKCPHSITIEPVKFTLFGEREVVWYSHHHFAFLFPDYQKNWQVVWQIFACETPLVVPAWYYCLEILHLLQPQQLLQLLPIIKIQAQFRSSKDRHLQQQIHFECTMQCMNTIL